MWFVIRATIRSMPTGAVIQIFYLPPNLNLWDLMKDGLLCYWNGEDIFDFPRVRIIYLHCGATTGSLLPASLLILCFQARAGIKHLIPAEDIFREDSGVII